MTAVSQITSILFYLLLSCSAEETNSPEQYLKPRDFNPHPYDTSDILLSKFYKNLGNPEPIKQGPILFPNDAPPPPKPPLIVTSRPLSESIARSELNPTPAPFNNSLAQPSYLSRVQIGRPNYAPINFYKRPLPEHDFNKYSESDDGLTHKTPESNYGLTYKTPESNYGLTYKTPESNYGLTYKTPESNYGLTYKTPESNYGLTYKTPESNYGLTYKTPESNYGLTYNKPESDYDLTGTRNYLTRPRNYGLVDPKSALDAALKALNKNTDTDFTYKRPDSEYGLNKKPLLNYGPINFYKKPLLPVTNDLGSLDNGYRSGDEGNAEYRHPYASLVKKSRLLGNSEDNRYDDYEERTVLPPIYKALSDHARQKVLNIPAKPSLPPPQAHNPKETDNRSDYHDYSNEVTDNEYGKKYAFSYSVRDHKTGDDFSHSQSSSGAATNGEYRVRLPDGRMQIVSYTADEGGYKADVRYAEEDAKETKPKTIENNSIDYQPQRKFDSKEDYYDSKDYNDYVDKSDTKKFSLIRAKSNFGPIVVPEYSGNGGQATDKSFKATTPYTILITPTKKPFYLQTQKPFYLGQSTPNYLYNRIPVEINVPSTTPVPGFSFKPSYLTTERVVHIGSPKSPLNTNIQNRLNHGSVSSTFAPFSYKSSTNPRFFYSSTTSSVSPENQRSNFVSKINK